VSARTWAGVLLVLAPIWFNVLFAVLAKRFEYPDVLRRPPAEVLSRFRDGGSGLILTWWAFMLSGLLLIPTVVVVGNVAVPTGGVLIAVAIVVGVLAGLVQMLGLLRWVYLVPWLARVHAEAKPEEQRSIEITFEAFHRFLGVGVGEHLGYLLTGLWSTLFGFALMSSTELSEWFGWVGIVIGIGLMVASLEFLGPNEERGWTLGGDAVPFLYIAWSLWLLAMGVALLI
jgi:Domain of unknown function (DUF4386)